VIFDQPRPRTPQASTRTHPNVAMMVLMSKSKAVLLDNRQKERLIDIKRRGVGVAPQTCDHKLRSRPLLPLNSNMSTISPCKGGLGACALAPNGGSGGPDPQSGSVHQNHQPSLRECPLFSQGQFLFYLSRSLDIDSALNKKLEYLSMNLPDQEDREAATE
jgi:hypothetical protein